MCYVFDGGHVWPFHGRMVHATRIHVFTAGPVSHTGWSPPYWTVRLEVGKESTRSNCRSDPGLMEPDIKSVTIFADKIPGDSSSFFSFDRQLAKSLADFFSEKICMSNFHCYHFTKGSKPASFSMLKRYLSSPSAWMHSAIGYPQRPVGPFGP